VQRIADPTLMPAKIAPAAVPARKAALLAVILGGGCIFIAVCVLGILALRQGSAKDGREKNLAALAREDDIKDRQPVDQPPPGQMPADQKKTSPSTRKKREPSSVSAKKPAASDRTAAGADVGADVYKRLLKSAAFIINVEERGRGLAMVSTGSGALIDKANRLVLTNYHVVEEKPHVIVFFPTYRNSQLIAEKEVFYTQLKKKDAPAPVGKVVARSRRVDLALVQLDALPSGIQALKLADASAVPGQRVHSIGNPGSSNALWLYTSGAVRQVSRQRWKAGEPGNILDLEAKVVETQSPTNPGDSGGPLVNDRSELIGVTEGNSRVANLMSIFIHVDEVRELLQSYSRTSGIQLDIDTAPVATQSRRGSR